MTDTEYGLLLKQAYVIARNNKDVRSMLEIINTAKGSRVSLNMVNIKKESITDDLSKHVPNRFPNPFDEETIQLGDDIKNDMPKPAKVTIADLANSFEVQAGLPRTSRKEPKEPIKGYRHKWSEIDLKTIRACMKKPDAHSHRKYNYIKGRLDPNISDLGLRGKLSSMGIAVKKDRLVWKKKK